MLSLKGLFGVVALAVLSQPAWALNDDVSGSLATGTTQANPPIQAAPAPAPVTRACPVCLKKPALSDAERARRKAIRVERAALGIQPRKGPPPRSQPTARGLSAPLQRNSWTYVAEIEGLEATAAPFGRLTDSPTHRCAPSCRTEPIRGSLSRNFSSRQNDPLTPMRAVSRASEVSTWRRKKVTDRARQRAP
jgi:hypothetical protein